MNTKAFLLALGIILLIIVGYVYLSSRRSSSDVSLTDVDLSSSPTGAALTITPKGNEALTEAKASGPMLSYTLSAMHNSGISGTANIKDEKDKLLVAINLTDVKGDHPAHFHTGTCENPGPIVYSLENVKNGTSQTTLSLSKADLEKDLPLIINVHKSDKEMNTIIACGVVTPEEKTKLQY